ncbi:MAG: D-alanyl-D-alanine carboxypeptidase/D-alanyl-D-alanine-endopeptidase [Alphaproteobacteria bacterium]|nr:D-alanyl-D-alanine carboxypeptidase/D-alanyl-D-alanine-endopeptidase [Alphaproteobacteria bacterium]
MLRSLLRRLSPLIVAGQALAADPTVDPRLQADAALVERIRPVLADRDFGRMVVGIHVVELDTGRPVVAWRADEPMVPASVMKVVTAAAALDALGPGHLFTTEVWATGELVDGVLQGDLVFRGGADPTLTAERIWRLLLELRTLGLYRVAGDVVLHDRYLQGDPVIPGWDNARDHDEGPSYFPPIGALGLDFGSLEIVVRPGPEPGTPAVVALELPAPGYVELEHRVTTGAERSRTRLELERVVSPGRLAFTVSGSVAAGASVRRFRRAYAEPTAYFAAVLRYLLPQVGLELDGQVRRGELAPDARRLRSLSSPSLAAILMDTNKWSSNYMAETVLRALGAEVHGLGTTDGGLQVVRAWLERIGVSPERVALANGSGLSRDTRLTAAQLTTVLRAAARDPRVGPELVSSLAIGGQDGTLRERFTEEPQWVRGKTGTLAEVHALAGFLLARDGRRYAFAILANDVRAGLDDAKRLMDALLATLREPFAADLPAESTLP